MTFVRAHRAIVVDASVAIELLQGHAEWTERIERLIQEDELLLVPQHFMIEVASALLRGLRMAPGAVVERIERLTRIGIETTDRGTEGIRSAVEIAERRNLTDYDAAYLDLAIDVDGELATLDGDLITAAAAEGVEVVA